MKKILNAIVPVALALVCHAECGAAGYEIVFDAPEPYPAVLTGKKDVSWESRSLPIGNGSIGANILGSVSTERITFNEKSLWHGGPAVSDDPGDYWNVDKQSAHLLPDIRQAFLDGDSLRADSLVRRNFNSGVAYNSWEESPFRFGNFTWMGEFLIDTGIDEADVSGYTRSLSLDSAMVTVSFEANGKHYKREYFISYPDNVMVARFSADTPQNISLRFVPTAGSTGGYSYSGIDEMIYAATLDDNHMRYAMMVSALGSGEPGGLIQCRDHSLQAIGVHTVTFYITADTDYNINFDPDFDDPATYTSGGNPEDMVFKWNIEASKLGFDRLLERHVADYRALFDRVSLSLNPDAEDSVKHLSTPDRLKRYREGYPDRYLEELYYQFGRYLLIASSRPGNLPANLQGIWHNGPDGPWHVDYHNNINIQMNYWPACMTGLPECMEPMIDFIRTLEKPGHRTAKAYFGSDGWTASISGNPFGFTAPLSSEDMSWNFNPMAGPWLATHLWDYYDYTRDTTYLRDVAYDLIKGSADFVCGYLWKAPDGKYMACPSTSPEHGPIDKGATFVHAVCRELLLDAIEASEVLDTDSTARERWADVYRNIAPYQVGRYGQLMEWSDDIDDPADQHRHVNHLFGLHPGRTITFENDPDLIDACRVVLEHRGDGATGWSMGWKLNQWARMRDGDHAYTLYGNLLKNGTLDNLWDTHPPFQIDGNFGGTAGVTEMLMQSHTGEINLLPALPSAWPSGKVTGLRAKGNFVVDIEWQDGMLNNVTIHSLSGGQCKLRYAGSAMEFGALPGNTYVFHYDPVHGL